MRPDLPDASKAVAVDILVHGAQSRAQLAKKTGLSAPTLTRLVRPLLEAGVLVESDSVRTPGRGRSYRRNRSRPAAIEPNRRPARTPDRSPGEGR